MSNNEILNVSNLSKSFNGGISFALKEVSFSIERGKIVAVVGESGCGKTTLLRLIAGLERPESGQIIIDGVVVTSDAKIVSPQDRNTGMVFQDFALFPHLTVIENIAYGLKQGKQEKTTVLMKLLALEGYENRYPHQLSGGQQQRVALARTLATNPELLLLDEPFSNLDSLLKHSLRKELQRIIREVRVSALFITHDLVDALSIADEVIFLKEGRLLEKIETIHIHKSAKTDFVQAILANLVNTSQLVLDTL